MSDCVLYLCSSVRHAYLAMGLANEQVDITHHLVFINQRNVKHNSTIEIFRRDKHPFASVDVYEEKKGFFAKYRNKLTVFKQLESMLRKLRPHKIFVGNDRRVEFQYAMHFCQANAISTTGAYLDDGSGSYVNGRYIRKLRTFTDLTFDRWLKRIFYGAWYDKHLLMGGTRWVSECYLNFPELAPREIAENKTIVPLEADTFVNQRFLLLAERFIQSQPNILAGESSQLFEQSYDVFLTLPLSNFVHKYFPSVQFYNELVNKYLAKYNRVAVKYHPRETEFYFESQASVTQFPASLPAELIFPFVDIKRVVGDLSSAVVSAVWLIPGCTAVCLCPKILKDSPIISFVERTAVEVEYC